MTESNPTLQRLDDQIRWYDRKSTTAQRTFKVLKATSIVAAASISVMAGISVKPYVLGLVGALIVVIEGMQQLSQYQSNWLGYRSTCEALRHEKYLYLAKAGPYTREGALVLLAERIESIISHEHSKWVSFQEGKKAQVPAGNAAPKQEPPGA